jgi:hypothetical protein
MGYALVFLAAVIVPLLFCHCGLYLGDDKKQARISRNKKYIMD